MKAVLFMKYFWELKWRWSQDITEYCIFFSKLSWKKEALLQTFFKTTDHVKLLFNVIKLSLNNQLQNSLLKLTKLGIETAGKEAEEWKVEKGYRK